MAGAGGDCGGTDDGVDMITINNIFGSLCVHGWLPSEGCEDCERDEEIRRLDAENKKLRKYIKAMKINAQAIVYLADSKIVDPSCDTEKI